jgi:hypothetical protein
MADPWVVPAAAALFAVAVLATCSSASSTLPGVTYPSSTFTCCPASDLSAPWQSGQQVTLHWQVQPGPATRDNLVHPLTITAVLAGPYPDLPSVKSNAAARKVPLLTLHTNDRAASLPPSTFMLPPDLTPGFYNLDFKFDSGGGNSYGGASIVRAAATP